MRARYSRLFALAVAGSTLVALGAGSAVARAGGDATDATGPFGITTTGLTSTPIAGSNPNYGEPSIATAPDGQHIIISTPGCGGVCYWRSSDDGATWSSVKTTGAGGDSEVDFVPQSDGSVVTLSADLAFGKTDSKQNSWIASSNDFGATWSAPKTVSAGIEQDRQWFAHSPDGKTEYLVYHDFIAEAEVYAKGTYNPTTKTFDWPQQDAAHPVNSPDQLAAVPNNPAAPPKPGDSVSILDQGANTYSGPMLIDPNGKDMYVVYSISDAASNADHNVGVPPYGPVRSIAVAHSSDGTLWQNRYAVVAPSVVGTDGTTKESSSGTMFPWGFIDSAGTVYVVFDSTSANPGTDHYGFYYVYSKDKGASWSTPVRLDNMPAGAGSVVFNTGAAVTPGVIDVAWLQKDTGSLSSTDGQWYPWFAQISDADTAHPTIVGTQKMADVANHNGGVCIQGILCGIAPGSSDRSLADFFELSVNPKTGMADVAYAQNAHDRSGENGRGEVVFAKQTVQPPLSPGATLPETPYLPLLPLAAVAALGGAFIWRRRRTVQSV